MNRRTFFGSLMALLAAPKLPAVAADGYARTAVVMPKFIGKMRIGLCIANTKALVKVLT